MNTIPQTQYAVQLVGQSELKLNTNKPINKPTGYQILAKVEATGLCFSDLKLLKQFSEHPRKTEVVSGITADELKDIPSYVAGKLPTVPGHESVIQIVAVGDKVKNHKVGERCLVQTDYRAIKTAGGSNAAFGYNFEGGLQEYVIIDERVSRDFETGERFLIPVGKDKSASAIALVEPWACVEDSFLSVERRTIKTNGNMLVVADADRKMTDFSGAFGKAGKPAKITTTCKDNAQLAELKKTGIPVSSVNSITELKDASFDDILYFGSDKAAVEALSSKIANNGIINIVTAGKKFGEKVVIGIGRVHYGSTRWIGTTSDNAVDSYSMIPETTEVRDNDSIIVTGAAGPMGQMHVIRNICSGKKNLKIVGTDFDDSRLAQLGEMSKEFTAKFGIVLKLVNPQKTQISEKFSYSIVMAPVPELVNNAINNSSQNSIVNIFAGIPAPTVHPIELDGIIEKKCYIFGTSGSTLHDMKVLLKKVEDGMLDTNVSMAAVSGMAGAIEGIAAVEKRTMNGKIIVYPQLHSMGLIPLTEIGNLYPSVASKLKNGLWTKEAEIELLKVAK